jgi:poly-gamma-glutamate synthesis protein (capsule biosynthesis protein)
MPELIKKLAEKLPCGKKCKLAILVSLSILLVFCIFVVWRRIYIEQNIFFVPEVLKNYNTLKSTQVETRQAATHTLIFGGDVMLARHVQVLQEREGGYETAWEHIKDEFAIADLAVINLESPFVTSGPYPTEGFVFRTKPENIIGLVESGIDVVQLANNHFGNAGEQGMTDTFSLLEKEKIVYVGAGTSTLAAQQGKIIEVSGKKIGLVAQSYDVSWYKATSKKSGIATLDVFALTEQIENLRKQGADFIVAMFHGGIEYVREPNADQMNFAHAAIDAGADVVIGHHPHWIQNMEEYKGKYIFYSLGNLIFDQDWSQETSEGLVVKLEIDSANNVQVFLHPVIIENNFKPRFATTSEAQEILKKIHIPFSYALFDNLQ